MKKIPQSVSIGQQFGSWVVIGPSPKPYSAMCRCACGKESSIPYRSLLSGHTRSCVPCSGERIAAARTTHGHSPRNSERSRTYRTWANMRTRCSNPNTSVYKHYGGRGISVCPQWSTFAGFLVDMGERPEGTSLDRIDVNGNYEPNNCRWATNRQQGTNRRDNRIIEFNGRSQTLSEWAEETGIPYSLLQARLNRLKWSVERSLTTPVTHQNRRPK